VNTFSRVHSHDQEKVSITFACYTGQFREFGPHWRRGEVERRLAEIVQFALYVPHALNNSVAQANNDGAALGVREADKGLREFSGAHLSSFTLEPLILRQLEQRDTDVCFGCGERAVYLVGSHLATLNMFECTVLGRPACAAEGGTSYHSCQRGQASAVLRGSSTHGCYQV
jgi:hypothetical protein